MLRCWRLIVDSSDRLVVLLRRRLSLDVKTGAAKFGEPRVPETTAAPAEPAMAAAGGRALLQGVNTNDFTCVGCPAGGPDTRTSVASTSSFPYSAIGQLMGQVTSNTCAPPNPQTLCEYPGAKPPAVLGYGCQDCRHLPSRSCTVSFN